MEKLQPLFEGTRVHKVGGDYSFVGIVVSVFTKRSGAIRYVVENDDGLLFIFNVNQLEPTRSEAPPTTAAVREELRKLLSYYCPGELHGHVSAYEHAADAILAKFDVRRRT